MFKSMASLKEKYKDFFNDCYFISLIPKHVEDKGSSQIYVSIISYGSKSWEKTAFSACEVS